MEANEQMDKRLGLAQETLGLSLRPGFFVHQATQKIKILKV